jgi:hypothetical protein
VTTLQLAIAIGAVFGLGITMILWQLVPAQPDLRSALTRLAPERAAVPPAVGGGGLQDRAGLWVHRNLPVAAAARVPRRELAVLRIPVHRYLGEKVLYAVIGLLFPTLLTLVVGLIGVRLPFVLPLLAGPLLAAAMSFIPDVTVRANAKTAREEFTRALGAYIDLVALERVSGSGSTQSLETAADIGDSWVYRRLREELARSRWSGTAPWDGLSQLAEELGLPELSDLGDIMRLSGEQGATVYATLRARSASLRTALLNDEHAKANAAGERMTLPLAALAFIFLLLLATPAVLRVVLGSP